MFRRLDLMPKKVDPLIKLTSNLVDQDLKVVQDVIKYKYSKLREWLEKPKTIAFWDIYIEPS